MRSSCTPGCAQHRLIKGNGQESTEFQQWPNLTIDHNAPNSTKTSCHIKFRQYLQAGKVGRPCLIPSMHHGHPLTEEMSPPQVLSLASIDHKSKGISAARMTHSAEAKFFPRAVINACVLGHLLTERSKHSRHCTNLYVVAIISLSVCPKQTVRLVQLECLIFFWKSESNFICFCRLSSKRKLFVTRTTSKSALWALAWSLMFLPHHFGAENVHGRIFIFIQTRRITKFFFLFIFVKPRRKERAINCVVAVTVRFCGERGFPGTKKNPFLLFLSCAKSVRILSQIRVAQMWCKYIMYTSNIRPKKHP